MEEAESQRNCKACGGKITSTIEGGRVCSSCGIVIGQDSNWFGSRPTGIGQWNGSDDNAERLIDG